MFKALLARLFGGWPADVPRFYPKLDALELAEFLSKAEYRRIKAFENVYILPFFSEAGTDEQDCFGAGLSRLLIRNLMLLRDVSIHGPEDTPRVPFEAAAHLATDNRRSSYVTGVAKCHKRGFSLRAEVHRPGQPKLSTIVEEKDFPGFVRRCTTVIGTGLGSSLETTVSDAWEVGQPEDEVSLIRCGQLELHFDDRNARGRSKAAKRALAEDRGFIVPIWQLDDDSTNALPYLLQALERDPYNAQLCFTLFCTIWKSQQPQPEAVQFCRKAIELSPGHGKAHMCVPHAAPRQADMLHHSELGYRLLPGNSFAVNNYILYLNKHGAPMDKLIELAEEGIETDPCDPGNYFRLIDLYSEMNDYRSALNYARRLQELFEPVMNERALYCLKQNPELARLIDAGEYDAADENRRLIADLRRRLK